MPDFAPARHDPDLGGIELQTLDQVLHANWSCYQLDYTTCSRVGSIIVDYKVRVGWVFEDLKVCLYLRTNYTKEVGKLKVVYLMQGEV